MAKFLVTVLIENKKEVDDPEGQTVYQDLILKGGYSFVQSVRSAKCLKIGVNAASRTRAKDDVVKMCDELRIYNPVVSTCTVDRIENIR